MARWRPRYPAPPEDVCDTQEEVDAYYDQVEGYDNPYPRKY